MRIRSILFSCALSLITAFQPGLAHATEGCTVNQLSGPSTLQREGLSSDATVNMSLVKGDTVETGPESTLDMSMNDLAGCRLLGGTRVRVAGWKTENMSLSVEQGNVILNLSQLPENSAFKVETPNAVATVRGTQFWGRVDPKDGHATTIAVREGRVEILDKASSNSYVLEAGQALDLGTSPAQAIRPALEAEMQAMAQADTIPVSAG